MRIVVINQYALPRGSVGITRHGDLASILVKMGNEVTIVSSDFNYLTKENKIEEEPRLVDHYGVNFICLKSLKYNKNDSKRILSMIHYFWSATFAGLKFPSKPDIVWASSPQILSGLSGFILAKYYGVPFVLEIRDVWPSVLVELKALKESSFVHKILLFVEKFLYTQSHTIISVLPNFSRRLEEVGLGNKVNVYLPNGIFLSENNKEKKNDSAEHEKLIQIQKIIQDLRENDKAVFLYTGLIGVAQDLSFLVEFLDFCKTKDQETYDKISFVFVGSGPEQEKLKKMIVDGGHQDSVFVISPIAKQLVPKLLKNADFLLLALANIPVFKYGISPNKLFDYLQAAKPILMVAPLEESIVDMVGVGVTCKSRDFRELLTSIRTLISLPEEIRNEMGNKGRNYVESEHDLERLAFTLESALQETVNRFRTEKQS
ncbi:glycosyltransferase family 4 protein [Geitlerinema sp. PCC 7407]|uniref:glycosyltransferase family 4 protein n=1 Tax=Geitlerinema sp. PCC 7407 TaxID=1173025 RepID=UPI00029FA236|nr:glycosyltransferase family 4 protein [Geitlerinema sp. PCC 7407]AFY66782.1 glycosyl transferase group 1 [Geitlerinema sp. PCC 7407]